MTPLELLLHELELRVDAGAGTVAVEGGASVAGGGFDPADPGGTPGFRLGFGSPEPAPATVAERFGPIFHPPPEGPGLWLSSMREVDGAPRWYAVFNSEGIDLWAVESLPAGAVRAPGIFELGAAEVRIALRVRGAALTAAHIELGGSAACTADLAGIGLASPSSPSTDGTGSWLLRLGIGSTATLGDLLDDPGRILDAPFTGELHAQLGYTGLAFPGGQLPATTVTLDATVSSNGDGALTVGQVKYRQVSSGDLAVGALTVRDADLSALLHGWTTAGDVSIELRGEAGVVLPPVLDPASAGTAFTTAIGLVRDSDGVRFELAADRITIDPAINLLELTTARLALVAVLGSGGDWSLRVRGEAVQSWDRLARRLRAAGLRLHTEQGFPSFAAAMELSVSTSNGLTDAALTLDLSLVEPGGASTTPYRGPLGPLPLEVADVRLHLGATVDDGELVGWNATGQGEVSAGPGLRDLAPFQRLGIEASVGVTRDDDPSALDPAPAGHLGDVELSLRVTNLPPIVVPALGGGEPTELLQVESLQVWLSDRVEVTAAVRLLPNLRGPGLADRLGLPEWNAFFGPIGTAVGDLQGWFRFVVPFSDGPVRAEIELRPGTPVVLDLAAMARDVVAAIGTALDATVPDDGRQVSGSLALIEPAALRFVVELGQSTSLSLSAIATCTLLGERFDAVLALALVNGMPELSLLAGVDDPVHVGLSAGSLIDAAASVDIPAMLTAYGVPTGKRASVRSALEAMHAALVDLFTAPGMEFDLGFEIRNLGVTFRPTDGDRMLQAGGAVRLTQLPGWLESVLPGGGPSAVLSTSVSSFRIELQMPTAEEGATRVEPLFEYDFSQFIGDPRMRPQLLSIVLRSLMIEYSWASNAVRVGWDVGFNLPTFNMVEQFGSGIALPDVTGTPFEQLATSGKLGTTVTSPPIPTVEWSFTSGDPADTSQRGIELVVGIPGLRFVTLFSRQFSLFPTYQMGQPALVIDGGVILGNPPEAANPDTDFVFMAEVQGGVIQLTPAPLGLIINPLAIVPPYLTPQPPYWLIPPQYMVDLYADAINLVFNVPGIVGVDVKIERPLPSLGLPALLELGLLAASGFDVAQIPPNSPIRKVCYARLTIHARLPIVELLGGGAVPQFDLTLEANVADLLELVLNLGAGVRDTLEAGSDVVAALVEEPDALVRAIPGSARRFTADVELAGFSLSGSLQLLTSDELFEEVVLFHESLRRHKRGVAALDDPCTATLPHHRVPLNTAAVLATGWSTQWASLLNPRGATPTSRTWQAARRRAERVLDGSSGRRQRALDGVLDVRTKLLDAMIDRYAGLVAGHPDPTNMLTKLVVSGLEPAAAEAAATLAEAIRVAGPPPASGAPLTAWRKIVRGDAFGRLERAPAFRIGEHAGAHLATAFADLVFVGTRSGRVVELAVTPFPRWSSIYKRVTGAALERPSRTQDALEAVSRQLSIAVGGRKKLTSDEFAKIRTALIDALGRALGEAQRGDLLDRGRLLELLGALAVVQRFRDRWTWDDRTTVRTDSFLLYDGLLTMVAVHGPLGKENGLTLDPGGTETVQRPVGWEVKVSDRVKPPNDVTLAPPLVLSSPRADIAVRFRGGAYELVVRDRDGGELAATPVPAAVLAHPEAGPPGPGRPARLRAMFAVAERKITDVVVRPPESVCTATHLYQDSLFARPEYRIDPTGDGGLIGAHGPLSLADLLRDPSSGEYVVAPGPVLVAGLTASLGANAELRLTGLISPEVTAGTNSAVPHVVYSAYLEGFSKLTVPFLFGYAADLEGSFTLIAGDMWTAALGGSGGGNSLRVDGSIVLRQDTKKLFEGSVSGRLIQTSGGIDVDLDVHVAVDVEQEVEIAGIDLARLWTSNTAGQPAPSTLDIHVGSVNGNLSVSAESSLHVSLAVAQLELHDVEITPETVVCAMVPKLDSNGLPVFEQAVDSNGNPIPFVYYPVFVEECVTIPAVTVPVPELGELGPPTTFGCSVSFSVDSSGMTIAVDVAPPAASGIPAFTLELGDLVPGS